MKMEKLSLIKCRFIKHFKTKGNFNMIKSITNVIYLSFTAKIGVKTVNSTPLISEEIIEDYDEGFDAINSLSFRRRRSGKRSKNWSVEESDRFYEALTIVGNDFQAISTAFSQRSLAEIKRKFMRENKQNSQRIDQLLRVHESGESNWDLRKGFKSAKELKIILNIC